MPAKDWRSGRGGGPRKIVREDLHAMKTESVLEKMFKAGHLAVTSECGPPRGALPEKVREKAEMLRGYVDAVNVTDNQTAMVRMSSFAACVLIRQMGLHPILQMVTRDRNRLAMQSDLLGAYAAGINTMLCLSGRSPPFRRPPHGGRTSTTWTRSSSSRWCAPCGTRANSRAATEIANPPKMFIGAAANPFADPFELRVAAAGQESRGRCGFHPDPVHLQPGQVREVDGRACGQRRPARRGVHHGGRSPP